MYIVDLIYLSTNQQYGHIKDYINTTRDLAKALSFADKFDKIAGDGLEKNIDKDDTINKIVDHIYTEMDSYLRSNDRLLTATQILVGSCIESQYMAFNLIKDETKNDKNASLFDKANKEGFTVLKLAELLNEYKDEKDFKTTIKDIDDLANLFKEYKGGDMDKGLRMKITAKVNEARANIVK